MTKYKGKNQIKQVRPLAIERANYKVNSFVDEIGFVPKNVNDFNFLDKTLYGRIDDNHITIYPKESKLKIVPQDGQSYFVLDFVAEQLRLFRNKIKQSVSFGKIPRNDPFLSNITIYKGYEDPVSLYKNYFENHVALFNSRLKADKIISYKNWIEEFIRFQRKNGERFASTFSGFQRTGKSNLFSSGLVISIANLDCADDEQKSQFFLENKLLEYYTKVAMQYGFYVNKSCPWILVSDLQSPQTILYRKNLGLSTTNLIFSEVFDQCYTRDIDYLRDLLEDGYATFIANNPIRKELIAKCNKTYKNVYFRKYNINNNKYNNIFYINLYITLKNIEENNYSDEAEEARVKKKATFFAKKLDNSSAIDYINVQFQQSYTTRAGTLNDFLNKRKKASEG